MRSSVTKKVISYKGRWCFVGDKELKNRIRENDIGMQAEGKMP